MDGVRGTPAKAEEGGGGGHARNGQQRGGEGPSNKHLLEASHDTARAMKRLATASEKLTEAHEYFFHDVSPPLGWDAVGRTEVAALWLKAQLEAATGAEETTAAAAEMATDMAEKARAMAATARERHREAVEAHAREVARAADGASE